MAFRRLICYALINRPTVICNILLYYIHESYLLIHPHATLTPLIARALSWEPANPRGRKRVRENESVPIIRVEYWRNYPHYRGTPTLPWNPCTYPHYRGTPAHTHTTVEPPHIPTLPWNPRTYPHYRGTPTLPRNPCTYPHYRGTPAHTHTTVEPPHIPTLPWNPHTTTEPPRNPCITVEPPHYSGTPA